MLLKTVYCFLGIFVAMDIIGVLPLYLGLTHGLDHRKRNKVVKDSIFVAAGVAFLFAYIGQYIFQVLGIKLYDFQIAGGLVNYLSAKAQLGTTFAVSYSNNNRLQDADRYDFDTQSQLFDYNDKQFRNNVLWGALFNTALKINNLHKISLQGTYSTNTDNSITARDGQDL